MEGKLIVISGFSGAGKGTVIRRLMEKNDGYVLSVSMTTRNPRKGETDGIEYHFVTNNVFEDLIKKDGFLEHAGFVDHYYGTPRAYVEENMRAGRDVLLEIEVQGAMQIRKKFPEAVLIFVTPPDAEELEKRLTGRATETRETVTKRLRQALTEVEMIPEYDYLVINGAVEACSDSLNRIIRGNREGALAGSDPHEFPEGGEVFFEKEKLTAVSKSFRAGIEEIMARREAGD